MRPKERFLAALKRRPVDVARRHGVYKDGALAA